MKVRDARAVAARWVAEEAAASPGFAGAFLSGSTTWLPDDAEMPVGSDVDVMVVTDRDEAPPKLGKFVRDGVIVEATYVAWPELSSVERVLSSCHLAAGFRKDTVLADPTGRLGALRDRGSAEWAREHWVRRRCADTEQRIVDGLARLDVSRPAHERVISWMFPAGITTHVLLTAGLRNPTVRLRYVAAADLLDDYGMPQVHEELLELAGCATMARSRVEHHLRAMTELFDATVPLARSPFFFASDITERARPIAVDGSRALVDRGRHREAVFWIAATQARCLTLLAADAPQQLARYAPALEELAADLGVADGAALERRAAEVTAYLPRLREAADAIIDANPGIVRP